MRYFFHIGYSGFNYRGWQRLPQVGESSIQFIIETQLSKILKTKVSIVGCSRTDSQVHAAQFFFHVDLEREWDFDLLFRINKNLPPDIAVFEIIPVDANRHARLDATARTYNYFIHTRKDPYDANTSAYYPGLQIDVAKVRKAVSLLPRYNDYRMLCKSTDKSTACKVTAANFYADESATCFRFEITSNRFLNGMIRIIVQKLMMIGRGELTIEEFENYLALKKRPEINRLAYPQGLYLTEVKYPFLSVPVKTEFFKAKIKGPGDLSR